jgi:hypothetical protein
MVNAALLTFSIIPAVPLALLIVTAAPQKNVGSVDQITNVLR